MTVSRLIRLRIGCKQETIIESLREKTGFVVSDKV